jgi:hypothetical protein
MAIMVRVRMCKLLVQGLVGAADENFEVRPARGLLVECQSSFGRQAATMIRSVHYGDYAGAGYGRVAAAHNAFGRRIGLAPAVAMARFGYLGAYRLPKFFFL